MGESGFDHIVKDVCFGATVNVASNARQILDDFLSKLAPVDGSVQQELLDRYDSLPPSTQAAMSQVIQRVIKFLCGNADTINEGLAQLAQAKKAAFADPSTFLGSNLSPNQFVDTSKVDSMLPTGGPYTYDCTPTNTGLKQPANGTPLFACHGTVDVYDRATGQHVGSLRPDTMSYGIAGNFGIEAAATACPGITCMQGSFTFNSDGTWFFTAATGPGVGAGINLSIGLSSDATPTSFQGLDCWAAFGPYSADVSVTEDDTGAPGMSVLWSPGIGASCWMPMGSSKQLTGK